MGPDNGSQHTANVFTFMLTFFFCTMVDTYVIRNIHPISYPIQCLYILLRLNIRVLISIPSKQGGRVLIPFSHLYWKLELSFVNVRILYPVS